MDEQRLAEIDARLRAGRLRIDAADYVSADGDNYFAWLAAAPTDIADLLAEVRRLREALEANGYTGSGTRAFKYPTSESHPNLTDLARCRCQCHAVYGCGTYVLATTQACIHCQVYA